MTRFSLSTAWNAGSAPDAVSMIRQIKEIGFNRIELNFALTSKDICDIISVKDKEGVEITSLHNFCPMPEAVSADEASPDYYPLSSLDEGMRKRAVDATKTTIKTARKLNASAVILHLGKVEVRDWTGKLSAILDNNTYYEKVKKKMVEERAERASEYFNQTVLSTEELLESAKEEDIILGIENRFYYNEIPSPDEIEVLLDSFNDSHIGYWHDVGHAQVSENMGIFSHKKDFLDRFARRLVGIHLHDTRGIDDHRAPLQGDFDFSLLKPYIKEDTLLVLEVQYPAGSREVLKGAEYLTDLFGVAG